MREFLISVWVLLFNDTATTEIYTLSLHDALPISEARARPGLAVGTDAAWARGIRAACCVRRQRSEEHPRSEEHTSELQSQSNLVCRLLLEKKKKTATFFSNPYHLTLTRPPTMFTL